MPHCVDYWISKISVRAVECVYSSQTTALIIGPKYPQHCRSKDKVIWTASICLPGTHQLEQGSWQHSNCGRKGHIKKHLKTALFHQNPYDKYFVSLSFYIIIYHKFLCTLLFSIITMWLSRYLDLCNCNLDLSYQHVLCIVHVVSLFVVVQF